MANKQIVELDTTTAPLYLLAADGDGLTRKADVTQTVTNVTSELGLADLAAQAQQSAFDAGTFAEDAAKRASSPKDTPLDDGNFSALHYQAKAADTARAAPYLSEKIIDDTVSSPYTLLPEDKNRCLVFTRSTALTVKCPQNWHNSPALDGSGSQAWVSCVRLGSGLITFTNESTTTVLTPTIIAADWFIYNTSLIPPPAYTGTHTLSVPAGSNRKFWAAVFPIFESNKVGRNSVLTATNITGLTKVISDTSTGNYAATSVSPLVVAVWTGTMADSTTSSTVTITVTPDADPHSYILFTGVVSNGAAITGAVGTSSTTNSATVDRAMTTTVDKSMVLFGMNLQGGDVLPLVLSGPGTQFANGRTGSRGVKDCGFIMGSHYAPTAGTFTYTMTSDLDDQGGSFGVIVTPNTGSLVASTLLTPDGATLSAAGKCCTIRARSDGSSFIKEG